MQRIKIAAIGAGLRAAQHLETLTRLTDAFELVGIAEQDPERAHRARQSYSVPVFQRPDEMLDEVIDPSGIAVGRSRRSSSRQPIAALPSGARRARE